MLHRRHRLALVLLLALGVAVPAAHAASPPAPMVLNGTPVAAGGFPFSAYISAASGSGASQECTGSVITPTVILTAAHCLFLNGTALPASSFSVTTGSLDRPTSQGPSNVARVIADPYYNPATFQNDAALLVLASATSAPAIALAPAGNSSLYTPGTTVTYAGWGETVSNDESSAPVGLLSGTVQIQPNATCQSAVEFHPGVTLCVAGTNFRPATCHGDSGGPLVESTPAGLVEIGITSYGALSGCGIAPDYFTRVSSVQSWIASAVAGTAAPPPFVPPFNPVTAPAATVSGDTVAASFALPTADNATLPTGVVVSLMNTAGAAVATQTLPLTATTTSFPNVAPGSYGVAVSVVYSEGSAPAAGSAVVRIAAPKVRKKPTLSGAQIAGYRLGCRNGTWAWSGGASFSVAWLRNGKVIGGQRSTIYSVRRSDIGKRLACRVTIHTTTSPSATANGASRSVLAGVRLKMRKAPAMRGTAAVGSKLVCTAGTWRHTGALGVKTQWLRNLKVIPKASRNRYVPRAADRGRQLACKVTVTATGQTAWYRTASRLVR
jgi:secreted trypsin-like serine protease